MSTNNVERPASREEYKILALRERLAQIVVEYEDRIAELRIDFTLVQQENENLKRQLESVPTEANEEASAN